MGGKDDPSKILFKSIMCPYKENCMEDIRPRWPTSDTKSVRILGYKCPYAHHSMELVFPESMIAKMNSTKSTMKSLK
jgi:hypothetical protein